MFQKRTASTLLWLFTFMAAGIFLQSCLSGFDVRSLSGVITDSENDVPIEDAEVQIRWESDSSGIGIRTRYDTTGSDGYYEFKSLPANEFHIKSYKSEYDTVEKKIYLGRGIRLNFEMTKSDTTQ